MGWDLLPLIPREQGRAEAQPRFVFLVYLPLVLLVIAVLGSPPVAARTGVSMTALAVILAPTILLNVVNGLAGMTVRVPVTFSTLAFLTNFFVCAAVSWASRTPATMLWSFFLVYGVYSAQASRPSWLGAGLCALCPPLVGVAWSVSGDVPWGESAMPIAVVATVTTAAHVMFGAVHARQRLLRSRLEELERAAAADTERRRIARDLHDKLGATLAEAGLWADASLSAQGDEAAAALARSRERTRGALDELRACVDELREHPVPVASVEAGLRERLAGLCLAGRARLALEVDAASATVSSRIAHELSCIAEEAVLNALRHGGARTVEVRVGLGPACAVEVHDDGSGFDPLAIREGAGLASMRARARALGGTVELETRPGAGCRVLVRPSGPRAATESAVRATA